MNLLPKTVVVILAKNNVKTDKQLEQERSQRIMEGVAIWASFYRANPHRFCTDYLNLALKLFQKILLFLMSISTNFMYLAARGQGKSFLVAIYCVIRCILYPGSKICLASKSRPQATEIIEKIKTILMPNSLNLCTEISDLVLNQANAYVEFHNTSRITVITANDNARHNRANILVVDEFRMVDLDIINKVLRKFLTAPRQPKYLEKPEYKHLTERNKEMYLSSCWFASHWSYEKFKAYCTNLVDDKRKYFVAGLPYQLSIKEGLLSAEQIEDEMSENDFSDIGFQMEMGCLWFSDKEGSLYSYDDISKTRKIRYPVCPPAIANLIQDKRVSVHPKIVGERRILSLDVALMSSKNRRNDAASIFINQLIAAQNDRYVNNIIFTENYEGLLTDQLALIARRLFHQFECTDLVIDCRGVGMGVLDALLKDIYDPETGETYGALSCCNNDEIAERCLVPNAPKQIWAINNQTAKFNSDCALSMREMFKQGKIRLLLSEFPLYQQSRQWGKYM